MKNSGPLAVGSLVQLKKSTDPREQIELNKYRFPTPQIYATTKVREHIKTAMPALRSGYASDREYVKLAQVCRSQNFTRPAERVPDATARPR